MPTPSGSSAPAAGAPAAVPAPAAKTAAVDPGAAAPAAISGAPAAPKPAASVVDDTWEVKENGSVVKKTRKEILEAYQLRQLSDQKRSEADKVLAEYKKVQEVAKRDPIKFMKAMGYDFDKLATSYLSKKAEDAMRDPKELENEKLRTENEVYKKWQEDQKTNLEKATKEKAVQVERERIHSEIVEAIKESQDLGLPVDEELIIAIAQKMLLQDRKQKPLNAKEALPAAYASTQKWLQGLASKMEGEALVKWLGNDVALKIRKFDLSQLKKKRAATAPASGSAVKPATEKAAPAKPYKTWSTFKADVLDKIK